MATNNEDFSAIENESRQIISQGRDIINGVKQQLQGNRVLKQEKQDESIYDEFGDEMDELQLSPIPRH